MPTIVKKKVVLPGTKHKLYQPMEGMPEAALTAEEDDPIINFKSRIENIGSFDEVEDLLKTLSDEDASNEFKIGGVVARAFDLFKPNDPQCGGAATFKKYIKASPHIRIGYRKAMHLRQIYLKLIELDVSWKAFDGIGWTKVRVLPPVLTKENIPEWVEKAKAMNTETLKAEVKAALAGGKQNAEGESTNVKTKTFKVPEDQIEVVQLALEKAKTEGNTQHDSVGFVRICQSYTGGGASTDWKQALTLAGKATSDSVTLVAQVVAHLKELWPDLEISVKPKGETETG